MSKRDEYIELMKKQLDELNAQVGELEKKAKAGQEVLEDKYAEHLAHAKELSASAMAQMNELRTAGEDRWEELVEEGEKVRKAFVHSVNYFRSQLK